MRPNPNDLPRNSRGEHQYRGHNITSHPKHAIHNTPVSFAHDEYDGPEDPRSGFGNSIEDAMNEIDSMLDAEETEDMPSMDAMEALACGDEAVFEDVLSRFGLKIEGKKNCDPLENSVQVESINSIASELTEEVCYYTEASPEVEQLKQLAEAYGFIVSYA